MHCGFISHRSSSNNGSYNVVTGDANIQNAGTQFRPIQNMPYTNDVNINVPEECKLVQRDSASETSSILD